MLKLVMFKLVIWFCHAHTRDFNVRVSVFVYSYAGMGHGHLAGESTIGPSTEHASPDRCKVIQEKTATLI